MWLPYLVAKPKPKTKPLLVVSAGLDYAIPKRNCLWNLVPVAMPLRITLPIVGNKLDSGQITASNFGPYNAVGAMARSLPPSSSPSRMIPKITRVLAINWLKRTKKLTTLGKLFRWLDDQCAGGFTARQPFDEGHNVSQDDMSITVVIYGRSFWGDLTK